MHTPRIILSGVLTMIMSKAAIAMHPYGEMRVVNGERAQELPVAWIPGAELRVDSITALSCFSESPIPDSVFVRMQGKSFKADCTVSRSELRYLTIPHHNGQGAVLCGELVCNKAIAADLLEIFREAFQAGYPIERMVLIDEYGADDRASMAANNTSCFNFRQVAGSKKLSNHARGLAIDVNPLYNPYVRRRPGQEVYVSPTGGRKYADRSGMFPYKIDAEKDLLYRLFRERGFIWGGSWKSVQDYQHFEKP